MARSSPWTNYKPLTFHLTGVKDPLAKIGREVMLRNLTLTLMKKITLNQNSNQN